MGATKEERETARLLTEHFEAGRRSLHGRFYSVPGKPEASVLIAIDHGHRDYRLHRNQLADVRRALRSVGINPRQGEESKVSDMTTTTTSVSPAVSPAAMPAAPAGMHIQRRRRTTVIEEAEIVVDLADVARLLGVATSDKSVIVLLDEDGNETSGIVTIKVKTPEPEQVEELRS